MAGKLYSLESVTYLTAGIADASTDPDVEVGIERKPKTVISLNCCRLRVS